MAGWHAFSAYSPSAVLRRWHWYADGSNTSACGQVQSIAMVDILATKLQQNPPSGVRLCRKCVRLAAEQERQAGEAEADADIAAGRVTHYATAEEAIAALRDEHE